jgi:glycosyltransferase involved in cell wall biosynthesis
MDAAISGTSTRCRAITCTTDGPPQTCQTSLRALTVSGPRTLTIVASDVAPIGGMERVIHALAVRLLERGWELTVISRRCEIQPQPGLRHVVLRRPARPRTANAIADFVHGTWAVHRHGRGLVHTNNPVIPNRVDVITAHFCEHAFRRRLGPSRARRTTPVYRLNSWIAGYLARACERWCYRPGRVRRVVCVAAGLAGEIREHFPAVAGAVTSIPNGVDHAAFAPPPDGGAAARHRLGLPLDVPVALFVGGDWTRKGLREAIEGVSGAPGWRLVVVGVGDRAHFAAHARRLGTAERVHFVGTLSDPRPAYWAADALVLPSAYEAFSLVTLEAAAAGLALVVTPVNGTDELVEAGVNGYFCERDGAAIAERLSALAADRSLLVSAGLAARRSAAAYDWERVVDAYEHLYAAIADEARGG